MKLWRLYRAAHGPGLDGVGGLHAAGRWHTIGRRVVYFGASAAIVVLEKLAHIDPEVLPGDLMLGCFEGDTSVEDLAGGFDIEDLARTRAYGEDFLKSQRSCVLRVPSVVLPEELNLVLNPLHVDTDRIRVVSRRSFSFDGRLLKDAAP
jgi:RES domain-containing protein